MVILISTIILIISLFGLFVIIFRKLPVLAELPEVSEGRVKDGFWARFKNKIKTYPFAKSFSFEIFLQKILSKVRILTLKTESKTAHWLQQLREKSQKKNLENKNYWQELKDSANKENK